jgi:hypothetical protein
MAALLFFTRRYDRAANAVLTKRASTHDAGRPTPLLPHVTPRTMLQKEFLDDGFGTLRIRASGDTSAGAGAKMATSGRTLSRDMLIMKITSDNLSTWQCFTPRGLEIVVQTSRSEPTRCKYSSFLAVQVGSKKAVASFMVSRDRRTRHPKNRVCHRGGEPVHCMRVLVAHSAYGEQSHCERHWSEHRAG